MMNWCWKSPRGSGRRCRQLVVEQMGQAADLSVPLDVQVGSGTSWYEAGH